MVEGKKSAAVISDRAGHDYRPVTIPTCAKGFLAAIKGLLGAIGLSETAPTVWPLPCPGFRPARLGNAPIPCSVAALLSTLLASCTTQMLIRQTCLHSLQLVTDLCSVSQQAFSIAVMVTLALQETQTHKHTPAHPHTPVHTHLCTHNCAQTDMCTDRQSDSRTKSVQKQAGRVTHLARVSSCNATQLVLCLSIRALLLLQLSLCLLLLRPELLLQSSLVVS